MASTNRADTSHLPRSARAQQCRLSALLFGVIALTYLAVLLMGHSRTLEDFSKQLQLQQWQRTGGRYAFHPLSRDSGDYLLLRKLPKLDFSRGGAVFIGSSTLQHAVITWDLPPDQAPYVHNLAVESANYKEQFHWVRYLVEHKGLASGGPGKMLVVLGLTHLDARDKLPGTTDSSFVQELFARHGLFDYDPSTGLTPAPLGTIEGRVLLEKMRSRTMLQQLAKDVSTEIRSRFGAVRTTFPTSDQAALDHQAELMGGDARWLSTINNQIDHLRRTITYLQQHGISVAAVLLPMKSFNDRQPYARTFEEEAARTCRELGVPLTDHSRSFADSEFADGTHLGHAGQHRMNPRLIELADAHLRRAGLQPAAASALR